jgi:hypothetical protein
MNVKIILIAMTLLASPVAATEFANPIDADVRRPHICGFFRCWYTGPLVVKRPVKPEAQPGDQQKTTP